jgi:hypothetical protein
MVELAPKVLNCTLAILDVNLGAGNPSGVDAYRWLKQERFVGRVVFLTGHTHRPQPIDPDLTIIYKPASIEGLRAVLDG